MKKSCHYGRTKWTAIFDGRSYIFMTTISMVEARGTLRPLAGFWFLNLSTHLPASGIARFRPLAGVSYLSFPHRCGGSGEQREPMGDGASTHNIRPLSSAPRITPPSAISCIARRIPSYTLRNSFRTCALVNRRTRSLLACIYVVRFMS